ncbi:MAG: hypothetical protein N2F24_08190, partial [Deltaproteobacteria bacterium]
MRLFSWHAAPRVHGRGAVQEGEGSTPDCPAASVSVRSRGYRLLQRAHEETMHSSCKGNDAHLLHLTERTGQGAFRMTYWAVE